MCQGGFFGALAATFGVVLPSFIIISLIALAMKRLMKYGGVQAFLNGIRPCIIAMILATALIMALETLFGFSAVGSGFAPNIKRIAMFAFIAAAAAGYKLLRKKHSRGAFCSTKTRITKLAVYSWAYKSSFGKKHLVLSFIIMAVQKSRAWDYPKIAVCTDTGCAC